MSRKFLIAVLAVALVGLVGCGGSAANPSPSGVPDTGQSYEINWGTDLPAPPFFGGVLINNAAKQVTDGSGGKATFKVYPANQLYSNTEALQVMSSGGSLQMANLTFSTVSTIVPAAKAFGLPYILPTLVPKAYTQLAGPGTPLYKSMRDQAAKRNLVILGGYFSGSLDLYSKVRVDGPAQLKGLKIRTLANDSLNQQIGQIFGYTPTVLATPEVGTALRQGAIDAAGGTPAFFGTFIDAGKYVVDPGGLLMSAEITVASKAWWDKLPAKYQKLITQALVDLDAASFKAISDGNAAATNQLKSSGKEFVTWSPASIKQAESQTKQMYDDSRREVGSSVIDYILKKRDTISSSG